MKTIFQKLLFAFALLTAPVLAFSNPSMFKDIELKKEGVVDVNLAKMITEPRGLESLSPYKNITIKDIQFKSEGSVVTKTMSRTPFTAIVQLDEMKISIRGSVTISSVKAEQDAGLVTATMEDGKEVALDIQIALQEGVAPVIAGVTRGAVEALISELAKLWLKK